jgi:hypothetical protein
MLRTPAGLGRIFATIILILLANHAFGQATVLVSNLTEASNGTVPVAYYPPDEGSSNRYDAAGSFTTGSSSTLLGNITLAVANGSGSGFSVALHSNAVDRPGTLLASLAGSSSPTVGGNYSYLPENTITLSANTTYWWVASVPNGTSSSYGFNLRSTASTSESSSAGWTVGDVFRQQNNSGGWDPTGTPLQFSVSASAIPEPSTYAALGGLIALGFAVWRRRRN